MTKLKKDFFLENQYTKTIETSPEEYEKLKEENPNKIVSDNGLNTHYDADEKKVIIDSREYTIIDDSLTHEEIVEEALFAINKKARITMYCAIFFVVLTLISMITTFVFTYKISKVTDIFDSASSYNSYSYWD